VTRVEPRAIRAGDASDVRAFIESSCRITKESFAGSVGDPLLLRPWQRAMLGRLFARRPDGRRQHRTALIGIPRKNGKTAIIAGVALYGLVMEDEGAEVYSVAGDRDQARLVFGTAKRMVELDEELSAECRLYRDVIEVPGTGSVYRALSADAPLKEGLSPTLTVVDEVHVIDEDLWNVFALAMGARPEPLMVGITTAGARFDSRGAETVCYRLFDYGRRTASGEIRDPAFYFEWWSAPEDLDYRDPATWRIANPGLGDVLDPEQLVAAVGPTPEPEFRTKHPNQWVVSMSAALPTGAWEACQWKDPANPKAMRIISPTEPIVAGFDGSWTGDSTALIGCTLDFHLFEIAAWERPPDDLHWQVEADEVDAAVAVMFGRYTVLELAGDPHEWRAQLQAWERRFGVRRITEWPTNSLERMVPAWKEFYAAVMEKRLTHDGSPGLARHVANAVLKIDARGARPTKETKSSGRKIDRLIAALIARDRAAFYADRPARKPRIMVSF
jgi:phage terminase large subunit-like protein